jgi:HSP20 family protein
VTSSWRRSTFRACRQRPSSWTWSANVLTVKAERRPTAAADNVEMQVAERPLGVFSRQLFLGEALDTEQVSASYDAGVLTLRIPVAEQAKPRKIEISAAEGEQKQINA